MIDFVKILSLNGRGSIEIGTENDQEFWLEEVDWGQAKGSHQTYSGFNGVGKTIGATTLDTRDLSITGWVIEDDTPLQTKCDLLNNFFSPQEDYLLIYGEYQIGFRPDDSIGWGKDYTKNNRVMRNFLLQATCAYPLFSQTTDTILFFDPTRQKFKFPTDFGLLEPLIFATTEKLYNVTIQNSGGFSTGVKISISFTGDTLNPRVKDLKTQEFIGVNRTFHNGERLEIITLFGSKSMTLFYPDGSSQSVIRFRNVDTTWLQLSPGSNIWAIECDNLDGLENMKVSVSFTPLFLEVE